MQLVAVLSTTVLPLDGTYCVKTLAEMPNIEGINCYIGHPATRQIAEEYGAIYTKGLFPGQEVGETVLTLAIKQGQSQRSDASTPHQEVEESQLAIRIVTRIA